MILITKEEIRYSEFGFDFDDNYYKNMTDEGGLMKSLSQEVRFSSDLTFRDFFRHLLREKEAIHNAFQSTIGAIRLDDFIEDIETNKKREIKLESVQISCRPEVNKKKELELRISFSGKDKKTDGNRENGVETSYGMGFSSLSTYADLPFRLNNLFRIEQYYDLEKPLTVLELTKKYTLYEVVNAVLYEITWHGIPTMRDKQLKDLRKRVKKIDSGEEKMIRHEEVVKELKEKINLKKKKK